MDRVVVYVLVVLGLFLGCSYAGKNSGNKQGGGKSGGPVNSNSFLSLIKRTKYDKARPPNAVEEGNNATEVELSVYVMKIDEISTLNMEMTITFITRMSWADKRLMFDASSSSSMLVTDDVLEAVWLPDTFYRNLKSRSPSQKNDRFLRIYGNGNVYFSQMMTATFHCPMLLDKFPLDRQTCFIPFETYGSTISDVILRLPTSKVIFASSSLSEFVLDESDVFDCSNPSQGESYPCLEVTLTVSRHLLHYIMHFFVPPFALAVMAYVSFWLHVEAVTARFAFLFSIILTIGIHSVVTAQWLVLPQVPYMKVIDFWLPGCYTFVFMALVEASVIAVLARKTKKAAVPTENRLSVALDEVRNGHGGEKGTMTRTYSFVPDTGSLRTAKTIDFVFRIVYILGVLLFGTIFWISYFFL